MAIIKKRKVEGFKTREEFEDAIDRIARLHVQIGKDEAALKKRHQDLDDKFGPAIKSARRSTGSARAIAGAAR